MRPFGTLGAWLRASRRNQILAAVLATAVVAAGVAVPLSLGGGPDGGDTGEQAQPTGCDAAPAIDPAAVPAAPTGAWRKVSRLPAQRACFSLEAAKKDATGVALDSTFLLVARGGADAGDLEKRLVSDPPAAFEVTTAPGPQALGTGESAARATRFTVKPRKPLPQGTLLELTLLDKPKGSPVRSWAFETQSPLRVVETLPGDRSTDVPLDIGIELTFSHDGVTGATERITISPATQGRFETHKRAVVFVPKSLEPRTLYTVTLAPGATVAGSGERIDEPVTFRFETGGRDRGDRIEGPAMQFTRNVWESATADPPILALYRLADAAPSTMAVTAYRFAGVDEFVRSLDRLGSVPSWTSFARSALREDVGGMTKVVSFTASIQRLGQYGDSYFRFPRALPAGFYLVQGAPEGGTIQAWLQVTDVALYASVSEPRTLVWANDVASKAPVAGATVRVAGDSFSTRTGQDGVALFDTPKSLVQLTPSALGSSTEGTARNLIVTAPGGGVAVVPLADTLGGVTSYAFRENPFEGNPDLWWRFLYTDRHLYRPTDRVHFWGLVRHRAKPEQSQRLEIRIGGFDDETGDRVDLASTTVTAGERGTFIGSLDFESASPGFYELDARVGDQTITSTYLEIQDFVKPAYKIDVTPSRKAVIAGDPVRFDIQASFFDGTPVPRTKLNYNETVEGSATTNDDGRARVDWRAEASGSFGESGASISVTPALAEEGDIFGGASLRVFPSSLLVEADGTSAAGRGTLAGTVYTVALDRLNREEPGDWSDARGPGSPGKSVKARVIEISYRKVEEGETYDFVNKRVVKNYRYEPVERPIGTYSATSGPGGKFTIGFPAENGKEYRASVEVADDRDRVTSTETYVYGGFQVDYGSSIGISPAGEGPYAIGDPVRVAMRRGPESLPSGGANRYLFLTAQNGILGYAIVARPEYTFEFAARHVPNVEIAGVHFAGVTYQEGAPYGARFAFETRKLGVAVRPDKVRYRPGEKPSLGVEVTDAAGKPVRAEVLLGVVDEAIFRLEGREFLSQIDILPSLYETVPSGILQSYTSHQSPNAGVAAEMGGEGAARNTFKDVALFDRVETGGDGRGSISFTLPDNLTSWRVTAIAVTQDLQAGSGIALVPVGLPLFADVAMNDTYITADRPSIKVRAFGESLRAGDPVSFEVSSQTLLARPLTATGTAFAAVDVPLGALEEGRHTVRVKATAGSQSDALERTIVVLPSRLVKVEAAFGEVAAGGSFTPRGARSGATRVTFTDHNRGRYYPALESLSWTYGDRVDQMLARDLAQDLLAKNFGEPPALPAEFVAARYQTAEGGIAIFPFASADLTLSARVAALAPDRFGRQRLAAYLRKAATDPDQTRERAAIALYGLAALGEPVADDVRSLAGGSRLTPRERLFAGLAAAEVGDLDTAERIYGELVSQYGQERGAAVRLRVPGDADDVVEATSLGAILGARVADDRAPALFQYTLDEQARERLVALEQISFLVEALPRLAADPVRFAYTTGGKRQEKELARGQSFALRLGAAGLKALALEVRSGTLGVSTSFLGRLDPSAVARDPDVRLTRSIAGSGSSSVSVGEGDLVRITLDFTLSSDAASGCYQVSDLLPSGLRAVSRPYQRGIEESRVDYPYAVDGQRVSFCASKDSKRRRIVYYARVIGTGTYAAEPAVIQSQRVASSINLSTYQIVKIS